MEVFIRVHSRRSAALIFCCALLVCMAEAQTPRQPERQPERHTYKIDLKIDFDNLTYTGTERVRWINRGEKPTSIIYFHLYPNLRVGDQSFSTIPTSEDAEQPRIYIVEVRSGADDTLLFSSVDD